MTDALWNGIIGAGGAAICCAVYYGIKFARKGISKIKFNYVNESEIKDSIAHTSAKLDLDIPSDKQSAKITLTIPSKKQLFTSSNIRSYGFIIVAILCFIFADSIANTYYSVGSGNWEPFEGDYYTNASLNLSNIADNTRAIYDLISSCFSYLFTIIGLAFLVIGFTKIKFK